MKFMLLSGRLSGPALLMERVGKKAEALKRMIAALGLDSEVLSESFPFGKPETKFDLITLRWVKLEPSLLKKIVSRLAVGGLFIHYSVLTIPHSRFSVPRFSAQASSWSRSRRR